MKVLQIVSDYFNSKLYNELFSRLNEHFENYIAVPSNFKDTRDSGEENIKNLKCFSTIDRFFYFNKQNKIKEALYNNFRVREFDLIHAHTLFTTGNQAYTINKKYGTPYIVAVRNTDLNTFFKYRPNLRELGCEILKNASKVIFLSPAYKKRLFDKYLTEKDAEFIKTKSSIIPNGIDDFWFENIGSTSRIIRNNKVNVLYIGRIDRNKNLLKAAKACSLLISHGYDIKYTVIGPIKNHRIFEKLNKYNFTKYISPKPKEELIDYFKKNDIFLMPSKTETFGLVYAEALSQGLPIIYSKGEGFDGQFEDGFVGYAVNPNDISNIAQGLEKTILNYIQISKRCSENINKFNWDNIAKQYSEIYNEINADH